ncbi:hypothetical protein FRX31_029623 [Thalictrum thalictroides]|uniref:Uncharacterized protein n=1 Tax=Thalictrum thalictroides TaxID=46969 RepID=A0A7J6V869_THATH|nr:hypothetical protein FRX31_029623 [Thalictrum thalictroides]
MKLDLAGKCSTSVPLRHYHMIFIHGWISQGKLLISSTNYTKVEDTRAACLVIGGALVHTDMLMLFSTDRIDPSVLHWFTLISSSIALLSRLRSATTEQFHVLLGISSSTALVTVKTKISSNFT